MDGDGPWIIPTTLDTDGIESLHITPDRYQLRLPTGLDAHGYAALVASHDTGSPVYTLQRGTEWGTEEREERVATGTPLGEDEDAVYIQQEGVDGRYTRSFYAGTDRDPAEIAVTVPRTTTGYAVAPLHDALAPFHDDTMLLEAVTAVEDVLARYEDGELDRITF